MGPGYQSQVLVQISSPGTQLVLEIPFQLWEKRHSALNHTQQTMAKNKEQFCLFLPLVSSEQCIESGRLDTP